MCKLLCEKYLPGEKWKCIVIDHDAWICLSDCNKKRSIYFGKREEKDLTCGFRENKESFSKGLIMIITGFYSNGKFRSRKVEKKKSKITWIIIRNKF